MFLFLLLFAAEIDSVAGTGEVGYAGDGGRATKALMNQPFHCASTARAGCTSPRRTTTASGGST